MSIDLSATRIISTIEKALIDGLIEDEVGMDESGDKWDAFSNEE